MSNITPPRINRLGAPEEKNLMVDNRFVFSSNITDWHKSRRLACSKSSYRKSKNQ